MGGLPQGGAGRTPALTNAQRQLQPITSAVPWHLHLQHSSRHEPAARSDWKHVPISFRHWLTASCVSPCQRFGKNFDELDAHQRVQVGGTIGGHTGGSKGGEARKEQMAAVSSSCLQPCHEPAC